MNNLTVNFSELSPELLEAYFNSACDVRGFEGEVAKEFHITLETLAESVKALGGLKKVYENTNEEVGELISDFLEWLFCFPVWIHSGNTVLQGFVNEYSLTVKRDSETEDGDWDFFTKELLVTAPLDTVNAEITDYFITIPFHDGVTAMLDDTIALLTNAGYPRLADAIKGVDVTSELSAEEVIAGHVAGVLLSGVGTAELTAFQANAMDAGLLPIWTNTPERKTTEETLLLYRNVIDRLVGAKETLQ